MTLVENITFNLSNIFSILLCVSVCQVKILYTCSCFAFVLFCLSSKNTLQLFCFVCQVKILDTAQKILLYYSKLLTQKSIKQLNKKISSYIYKHFFSIFLLYKLFTIILQNLYKNKKDLQKCHRIVT